jgi:mono/diheme cytochrome c family protein
MKLSFSSDFRKLMIKSIILTLATVGGVQAGDHNYGPYPEVYVQECGSCHTPYPAKGLSQAGWNIQLSNLGKHFGTDASLDAHTLEAIRSYLMTQSGRKAKVAPQEETARMTKTRWFLNEHGKNPPTGSSFSNCTVCHTQADKGDFNEKSLKLPKGFSK